MICKHAASGCNYPEGECAGTCRLPPNKRQECITLDEDLDQPVMTLALFMEIFWYFVISVGMMAAAAAVGLYFSGFFHWMAAKNPTGVLAWLLGVGA